MREAQPLTVGALVCSPQVRESVQESLACHEVVVLAWGEVSDADGVADCRSVPVPMNVRVFALTALSMRRAR